MKSKVKTVLSYYRVRVEDVHRDDLRDCDRDRDHALLHH
jgi:hypothetical protein